MSRRLLPLLGQPDPYTPKDVHLVGRYALGVTWGDDHGSIFPFASLRRMCPCGACAALEALPAEAVWPREITRAPVGLQVAWTDAHESTYPYVDLRAGCQCASCKGGH